MCFIEILPPSYAPDKTQHNIPGNKLCVYYLWLLCWSLFWEINALNLYMFLDLVCHHSVTGDSRYIFLKYLQRQVSSMSPKNQFWHQRLGFLTIVRQTIEWWIECIDWSLRTTVAVCNFKTTRFESKNSVKEKPNFIIQEMYKMYMTFYSLWENMSRTIGILWWGRCMGQ